MFRFSDRAFFLPMRVDTSQEPHYGWCIVSHSVDELMESDHPWIKLHQVGPPRGFSQGEQLVMSPSALRCPRAFAAEALTPPRRKLLRLF